MEDLTGFLRSDATYAKLEKEGDEMSRLAMEALQKSGTEGDGGSTADVAAESEKFRLLNEKLTINSQKMELAKNALLPKYNEAVELEKGMVATNALGSNVPTNRLVKSPLDFLMETKAYEDIPDYHDRETGEKVKGMKKWDSTEAHNRRNISVTIPASKMHPSSVLRSKNSSGMFAVDSNAITTATMAPYYQGIPGTTPYAIWSSGLLDLVNTILLTSNSLKFRRQDTFTRNAAATAETGSSSQSKFTTTLDTATAQRLSGYDKISEEELMMQVDALPFTAFNAERELKILAAQEILTGNNTGVHFNGIYGQATSNLAKSACPIDANSNPAGDLECLGYTTYKIRSLGACTPNLAVMHPNQFMPILLLRNRIGDRINYSITDSLTQAPNGDFYFLGVRYIQEAYAIDGQALIGDFASFYQLALMQSLTIEMGMDASDFTNFERTMRFWLYGCNVVRRTSAFGIASGLTSQGMTLPS
jgi:hypothetical protein